MICFRYLLLLFFGIAQLPFMYCLAFAIKNPVIGVAVVGVSFLIKNLCDQLHFKFLRYSRINFYSVKTDLLLSQSLKSLN